MASNFLNINEGQIFSHQQQTFSEKNIFPILPASSLLASSKRKKILSDIKFLAELPEEHYQALYQQLIDNFAATVQVLPTNNEARLFSLLDEGLLRGLYILQIQQSGNSKTKPEAIINYALFSAALLFDIGYTIENRMVIISDEQGGFIREWFPYQGALNSNSNDQYYKIRRSGGIPPWVCRRIAVMLARQIMPTIGFEWISSDAFVFNSWLTLLLDDKEGAGALGLLFTHVEDKLKDFRETQAFFDLLDLSDIEIMEPKETALGEEFIEWIKKGIESGSISVNKPDSNIQVLTEGTVIRVEALIKSFGNAVTSDMDRVYRHLEALGLVRGALRVLYNNKQKGESFNQSSSTNLSTSLFSRPNEAIKSYAGLNQSISFLNPSANKPTEGLLLSREAGYMLGTERIAPRSNVEVRALNPTENNKLNVNLPQINISSQTAPQYKAMQ